jgi:flagellar biosynthetic protein FlhB
MADGKEESDNDEDKTEDPSEYKLKKAYEEGNVPFSKEILQLLVIISGTVSILYLIPYTSKNFLKNLTPFLGHADSFHLDGAVMPAILKQMGTAYFWLLGLPFLVMLISVISGGLAQKGKALSLKSLKPKLSNISLQKGFKRIFSSKALVEFIKNIIKIIALGSVIFYSFKSYISRMDDWIWLSIKDFFKVFHDVNFTILMTIILAFGLVTVLDYMYQRYTFMKQMRMTKHEMKEEYKQIEGDPHVKQRIRQLRMERAQNRMMKEVPTATAVLMNPTHYAVAIKWDEATMDAPKVVAKGQDIIALKIKEIALANNIPVIENPPLTRSLFSSVDLDAEIPPQFYKAIADVIRIVMRMKQNQF